MRKFGREDAVFFYNKGVEVDFYIPDAATAIQVSYNLDNSEGTFDRKISALVKLSKVIECQQLLVITRDDERTIEIDGLTINVVPIWKWLLGQ